MLLALFFTSANVGILLRPVRPTACGLDLRTRFGKQGELRAMLGAGESVLGFVFL